MKALLLATVLGFVAVSAQAQSSSSTSTSNSAATANANALALARGGRASGGDVNNVSVSAPGLAASGACLGSVSAGVGAGGFGLSMGSTHQDDPCNRRENARVMQGLGYKDVAVRIMLQDPMVAGAMVAYSQTYYRAGPNQRPKDYPQPPRYSVNEPVQQAAFVSTAATPRRAQSCTNWRNGEVGVLCLD